MQSKHDDLVSVLPHETLVRSFSFLATGHDLASVMLVCKSFNRAAHEESIWKEGCFRKYGSDISEQTVHLYPCFYEMLKDDNSLGASPIRYNPGKFVYVFNEDHYFFCCLIRSVKWHRPSKTVQVFVDARGETDLRDPITSGLWRVDRYNGEDTLGLTFARVTTARTVTNLVATATHKKAILVYPEDAFAQAGHYVFCYANTRRPWRGLPVRLEQVPPPPKDYTNVSILHVKQNLQDAFAEYSLENGGHPEDTEDSELELWRQNIPQRVLERQDPPWWT